ncbi:hypothetical protein Metho_0845 [Methanomethylovorans hollandica DSM 15978]|uniref:Phosphatase/phosphohexomutase n=1 Tax=Methanomethylovorans hollandica (strain DSM 15978 / NBRC 107637 / DMS1) TaxID=867904 RepID=L0KYD3_METHD|nr:HAD hydrolase-like protein [Methanomethylovorans hollandica]AGB49088.1 hypothetical protein Metho_0845 [Methanomethylovorans hollandica DSM 15978]
MKPALIFDMDGVLVDSMHLHVAACEMAFSEACIHISPELIYEPAGSNDRGIMEKMLSYFSSPDEILLYIKK